MSNRSFTANSWLLSHSKGFAKAAGDDSKREDSYSTDRAEFLDSEGNPLPPLPTDNSQFVPSRYFIPGWSGNSLFSKTAVAFKKIQEQLWEDALYKFNNAGNLPPSLSQTIHNEFLGFLKTKSSRISKDEIAKLEQLRQVGRFWKEMKNNESSFRSLLDEFSELYSFRVATNYLCRLKFLVTFSRAVDFPYTKAHIMNPSSFSQQLFRKGSSTEIHCEAFKINQYSWYRPNAELTDRLEKLTLSFHKISITQMMKMCSYRAFQGSRRSMKFDELGYSHALSHKAFGQFLNNLMIFFPLWQRLEKFEYPLKSQLSRPEILNTRFVGENIESLGQSHWLAQEANMNLSWSEILCSEFASEYPGAETFVRLGQELHFLTFLVSYSRGKRLDAKELLSRITREKFNKISVNSGSQFSLFSQKELTYDRCVLNVGKLPKKNPHHYLINKIQSQKDSLLCDAYLVVLSNQKLFVPSQSKKVADLLQDFKVEGMFNLEKLKGKGEITNFIYILKKRDPFTKTVDILDLPPSALAQKKGTKQESCYTFRWEGELKIFSQFETLVKELNTFFKARSSFSTSISQKNLSHDLHFEFHQDAIIDGKLLSSLNKKNESNITHPQFFKNLTKSCVPLEKFFSISELNEGIKSNLTNDLLGISDYRESGNYQILIINLTESMTPTIEICNSATLQAKKEEYGEAYYYYYKITPKISHINFNLLKEFFESGLGKQIIQICLSGGPAKLKGKLRSLLVPRIFGQGIDLQNTDFASSPFLSVDKDSLLKEHPLTLKGTIHRELERLEVLKKESKWAYLSLLAHLKVNLRLALEEVKEDQGDSLAFDNPLICQELVKLDTYSVYPNDEVYTEILIDQKNDLDKPVTRSILETNDSAVLKIYNEDTCLLQFHADKETLLFIDFIIQKAKGYSFLKVLQNLKIPKAKELRQILAGYDEVKVTLNNSYEQICTLLQAQITKEIARV